MATIADFGGLWTLTLEAAELMVKANLISECPAQNDHNVLDVDKPVFHVRSDRPDWFGSSTLLGTIREYESKVEIEEPEYIVGDFVLHRDQRWFGRIWSIGSNSMRGKIMVYNGNTNNWYDPKDFKKP